jgi:hypothetical protein
MRTAAHFNIALFPQGALPEFKPSVHPSARPLLVPRTHLF